TELHVDRILEGERRQQPPDLAEAPLPIEPELEQRVARPLVEDGHTVEVARPLVARVVAAIEVVGRARHRPDTARRQLGELERGPGAVPDLGLYHRRQLPSAGVV